MEGLNLLQSVAVVCGSFITIITLLSILIKPIRNMIIDRVTRQLSAEYEKKEREEFCEMITEATRLNREAIEQSKGELKAILKAQEEQKLVLRQILANTISHIYHKYINEDVIPELEKKNLMALYAGYHDVFEGNSYVTQCYNELMEKRVII